MKRLLVLDVALCLSMGLICLGFVGLLLDWGTNENRGHEKMAINTYNNNGQLNRQNEKGFQEEVENKKTQQAGFVYHDRVGINSNRVQEFSESMKRSGFGLSASLLWAVGLLIGIAGCFGLVAYQKNRPRS